MQSFPGTDIQILVESSLQLFLFLLLLFFCFVVVEYCDKHERVSHSLAIAGPNCLWVPDPTNETYTVSMYALHVIIHSPLKCQHINVHGCIHTHKHMHTCIYCLFAHTHTHTHTEREIDTDIRTYMRTFTDTSCRSVTRVPTMDRWGISAGRN